METGPRSVEKQPISAEESKQKLLYYLEGLEPEKLEAYFEVFDVPQEAIKDAEVQAKVDEWLQTLSQVLPKQVGDLLNRLFKS